MRLGHCLRPAAGVRRHTTRHPKEAAVSAAVEERRGPTPSIARSGTSVPAVNAVSIAERGLAGGDDVNSIGTAERLCDIARERAVDQASGIHGRYGFAEDRAEMLSELGNGGQFTCRGSAQEERPATRSIWRRTWLTTWFALFCSHSVSSCDMICVSARSTSLMVRSE